MLETVPRPRLNRTPPARHMITCIGPAFSGVISGIVINSSIPTKRERRIESQVRCFPMTLMTRKIAENTAMKKIFASMASETLEADADDIEGFEKFTKRYSDCIPAEKAAIETLKD